MQADTLLELIDRRIARQAPRQIGWATAAGAGTIRWPGDTAAVPVTIASGVTVTAGDTVIVAKVGTAWVIIGRMP
jgi:hypothetical protein